MTLAISYFIENPSQNWTRDTSELIRAVNRIGFYLAYFMLAAAILASAELKPETLKAYEKYIRSAEEKIATQNRSQKAFLWIDRDPERRKTVQNGEVPIEQITAPEIDGGLIQHWIGAIFFPKVTLEQVKRVDQDYANYGRYYAPDITNSKLLSKKGNHFHVSYRLTKQKVFTVVMDTKHDIEYLAPATNRLVEQSRSFDVRQVKNAGSSSEKVLAVGKGDGFLWAMNTYWRLEERDAGVYVECEAITLARSIPSAVMGIVSPIVDSFAKESLTGTLKAKRRVVEQMR